MEAPKKYKWIDNDNNIINSDKVFLEEIFGVQIDEQPMIVGTIRERANRQLNKMKVSV